MFSKLSTFRSKAIRSKAMFSKLSTFRSKAIRSKREKLHRDENDQISKASQSYFPSISTLTGRNGSGVSPSRLRSLHSNVSESHLSSSGSIGRFSVYDENESITVSSVISEEVEVGTHELLSYEDAEEEFLEDNEGYFVHLSVDNVRKDQYPKLEFQRIVYLDYATCPLYSQFQVEQHMKILLEESRPYFGLVPTTVNLSSQQDSYIDITSKHLLNLFNTNKNDYTTIFTLGLAPCYQLFAEMHRFQKGSILLVSPDNHESCKYVIHTAVSSGAKTGSVPIRKKNLNINGIAMNDLLIKRGWSGLGCGIMIYPAQSYFSGICHSQNWTVGAQQNGWKVLLDVTNCIPTVSIDLSLYQPEFVVGSLQHALGYPSDVGYMLVRRSSHSICTEKGSTQLRIAEVPEHGRFVHVVGESLSLHTFAALSFGLKHLQTIGMEAIRKRVDSLVAWLVQTLRSFKHKVDNKPLLQIYGSLDLKNRGSILAFNVLDSTGNVFPAGLVRRLAEKSNIYLGAGSLGNPDLDRLLHQKSERQPGADPSMCSLSVVRVSLGAVSTFGDVYRLAQFLFRFSDEEYTSSEAVGYVEERGQDCWA